MTVVAHRFMVAVGFALASAALDVGCGAAPQAPRVERMSAEVPVNQSAALQSGAFASKSLLVEQITGEQPSGDTFNSLRDALWFAMESSLTRSHIFREVLTNGSSDYKLDGKIVSHKEIPGSLSATSAVLMVRYKLTDSSGRVVWQKTITSQFDQPVGTGAATTSALTQATAAAGGVLILSGNLFPDIPGANEGVVRDNLTKLLNQLATLSLAQSNQPLGG
jgi:hypothetical protein